MVSTAVNNVFYRLYDGGFSEPNPDDMAYKPSWKSWMENAADYVIVPDMKYSGIKRVHCSLRGLV